MRQAVIPLAVSLLSGIAVAQNDYGIDFVRIGAVNNPAFDVPTFPPAQNWPAVGSGSVPYEYRMGRTEVTTAQWMAFVNTFNTVTREEAPPFFDYSGPYWWGAVPDPAYHGPGYRYVLPANRPTAALQPVFGISWRQAALYCNWLNNGQSSDPASLLTGAYDVSTWGTSPGATSPMRRRTWSSPVSGFSRSVSSLRHSTMTPVETGKGREDGGWTRTGQTLRASSFTGISMTQGV